MYCTGGPSGRDHRRHHGDDGGTRTLIGTTSLFKLSFIVLTTNCCCIPHNITTPAQPEGLNAEADAEADRIVAEITGEALAGATAAPAANVKVKGAAVAAPVVEEAAAEEVNYVHTWLLSLSGAVVDSFFAASTESGSESTFCAAYGLLCVFRLLRTTIHRI